MLFHLISCYLNLSIKFYTAIGLLTVSLLIGCFESIGDLGPGQPIFEGFYYLDNRTPYVLNIEAMTPSGPSFPLPLMEEIVPSDTIVNFYSFQPGYDTDFAPTSVFGDFKVTADIGGKDSVIYQAVWNPDWEIREVTVGPHYYLTLPL